VLVEGVHDSKKMSHEEREQVYAALTAHPQVRYAVAILEHTEIDQINILEATMRGMERAAEALRVQLQAGSVPASAGAPSSASAASSSSSAPASSLAPLVVDLALIDGNRIPKGLTLPAESVVKGDSKMYSIAAASVIAKGQHPDSTRTACTSTRTHAPRSRKELRDAASRSKLQRRDEVSHAVSAPFSSLLFF